MKYLIVNVDFCHKNITFFFSNVFKFLCADTHRWVCLLKQQLSITIYCLPMKEKKLPFLFAANKQKLPVSISSIFHSYMYINMYCNYMEIDMKIDMNMKTDMGTWMRA
jgi:hypothetical protein